MQPSYFQTALLAPANVVGNERALTKDLWRDFNPERAQFDSGYGFYHHERGQSGAGNFTLTQASSGTGVWSASVQAGFGPTLFLDAGAVTDNQGPNVQWTGLGVYPLAGMTIYGEWMARVMGNATPGNVFFGLATVDTTVLASDLNSAADWIGFLAKSSATMAFGADDGTEALSATAVHTILNGTSVTNGTEWMHHGFRWVVGKSFDVYINRAKVNATDVSIVREPDGPIVVTAAVQANGTTQPVLEIANFAFGFKR